MVKQVLQSLHDRIDRHELFVAVFDSPDGKRVLMQMAKECHFFKTTFVPGDPATSAFREGQRHTILSILKYINKDQSDFIREAENMLRHE